MRRLGRYCNQSRNFACAICVFEIFSTAQQNTFSWALSVRKAVPSFNSDRQKVGNSMSYGVVFTPEAPVQIFHSHWLSIWGECKGFEKSWMSPLVFIKSVSKEPSPWSFWWEKNCWIRCVDPDHYWQLSEQVLPSGWGCRIHWLHLCRGARNPNKCPGYDTKQFDGTIYQPLRSGRIWHKVNF